MDDRTPEDEIRALFDGLDPLATQWLKGEAAQFFMKAALHAEPDELRETVEIFAKIAFHDGLNAGRKERKR